MIHTQSVIVTNPRFPRRRFLGGVLGAAATAPVLGASFGIDEAWAGSPTTGSLDSVEHVVILMQENRSFDHYYGTMAGVRGFGDRAALRRGSSDVFHQPDPARLDGGYLLPFHVDTTKVDGQDLADLPHDWDTTHLAFDGGLYDRWVAAKSEATMGYFTATDIPFQRALASAFTICDNYFCSIQGPTTPNRLFHWTGTIDPDGRAGGPATANPDDYKPVFTWTTYPERLQKAGVSWQVYANDEVGDGSDGYVGDYGDNPLWLFQAYHDALASTDPKVRQLADRASLRTAWKPDSGQGRNIDHVLAQFLGDCATGSLPAVSWVVAPYLYSEHPAARPVDGAAYVQAVLNGIWANQKLRDSTVVFLNYDENDGFYDHIAPPVAPPGTPQELLPASQPAFRGLPPAAGPLVPIGLGPRVPMTVVSPWSRGGFVNSQVADHTSVLRFLETWTGIRETNISAWRRAMCGDLTSCFDFSHRVTSIPSLPDATALRAAADRTQKTLPPSRPPTTQVAPAQDPGTAPARPLPYQPEANLTVGAQVTVAAANHGSAALQLAVYPGAGAPQHVDVTPGGSATATVPLVLGAYDVAVHGPNGFLRTAAGDASSAGVEVAVTITGSARRPTLTLRATNTGTAPATLTLTGGLLTVPAGATRTHTYQPFEHDHGWYDITATWAGHPTWVRRFAGHLENGLPSVTG